jgi:hypothetical protein
MVVKDSFRFDGKDVEDNILFYWSIVAISRALRFSSEAQHKQESSYVLASVAAYYSIFHLGMFLLYSAPHLMPSRLRSEIKKELSEGSEDPRKAVRHVDVERFLNACSEAHGLSRSVVDLFEKAKALRVFANYGPDLQYVPGGSFQVFNRRYRPEEVCEVIGQLNGAFDDAISWVATNAPDGVSFVSIALSMAAPYFNPNPDGDPYYSEWSSSDVLKSTENLRRQLEQRAHELIYSKEAPNTGPQADGYRASRGPAA